MDDVILALHAAVRRRKGGITRMAQQLGKREKTLFNKLDPADDTHQPTIGELIAILHLLDEPDRSEVIDRFCAIFGGSFTTRSREIAADLTQAVIHSVGEHADVVREFERAIEDGRVDYRERQRILRECSESRRAIQRIENTLLQEVSHG